MRHQSALISGAGIAGAHLGLLACVLWLRANAPRLRKGGYVIDFWGLGYDSPRR
jgi:hypothetical protein